jgi:NAD(P)-dependent dehydrogenase (short-subunit alcohol dehydrogenase family)
VIGGDAFTRLIAERAGDRHHGCERDLGEATARLLSSQGAAVVLGARRLDRLKSLAGELTASGGKAIAGGDPTP